MSAKTRARIQGDKYPVQATNVRFEFEDSALQVLIGANKAKSQAWPNGYWHIVRRHNCDPSFGCRT